MALVQEQGRSIRSSALEKAWLLKVNTAPAQCARIAHPSIRVLSTEAKATTAYLAALPASSLLGSSSPLGLAEREPLFRGLGVAFGLLNDT